MSSITLITGGGRSGKSSHALHLAKQYQNKVFIATAEAFDQEMAERIANHKAERTEEFTNIESPIEIVKAIESVPPSTDLILLDCLTVWLGNLSYHLNDSRLERQLIDGLIESIISPPCDIILVTNEIGMGLVPETAESRKFRDAMGRLNQQVAQIADRVVFVVSGIPMVIKDVL